MTEYNSSNGRVGDAVIGAYKKIEDRFVDAFLDKDSKAGNAYSLKTGQFAETIVNGYKNIEEGVVGGYKKIEDKFVDAFLQKKESGEAADSSDEAQNDDSSQDVDPSQSTAL